MNHFHLAPRRCLYRMVAWFFLVNALVSNLVVLGYCALLPSLQHVPGATPGSHVFGALYFFSGFFAQICLYQGLCALFCMLVATLFPWRALVIGLASILGATLLAAIIGDTIAFRLYHLHYAQLGWQIYRAGALAEVLAFGLKEQLTMVFAFGACCLLEVLLALWLWRVFSKPGHQRLRRIVFSAVFANLVFVYLSFGLAMAGHVWPSGYRYAILRVGRISPYLSELYVALFERNQPVRDVIVGDEHIPILLRDPDAPLAYPKHAMQAQHLAHKPYNIVMIAIDTWRFSAMTAQATPHIYDFAQQAVQFDQHFSGGNCTQPGLFSLFYGLPPNYWGAFLTYHKSPVLMNLLEQSGYHLGIFLSAPMSFPRFDKTIFSDVLRLTTRTDGDSSIQRDRKITRNFLTFLQQHQGESRPFFSFLFYDAVHNYCEPARPKSNPFQPAVGSCDRFSLDEHTNPRPYMNLYLNKVHFVDHEIGRVLNALRAAHHDQDTIVIITADHGEEVNDHHSGLWGHASAYDAYQLHVPFLVRWPGHAPAHIAYQTQHYDVAPTLIREALGYVNPFSDYAVGQSLWQSRRAPYYVAGSYGDYAVVTPQQVMRIYPNGDYALLDPQGRFIDQDKIDKHTLGQVLHDLYAFFEPTRP